MSNRTAPVRRQFGTLLKEWRRVRRKSQLDVALEADISPRHLSFVESGRSAPSREMVQLLTETLDVPLRERNSLLVAAGYAPMYNEGALESSELTQVRRALARLLEHQEPYPAVVLDRQWNIVQTNRAAPKLFSHFIELSPGPVNLLKTMFDPARMRPWVANWDVVAQTLMRRVYREAVGGVPDARTLALLDELQRIPGSPAPSAASTSELPFFPVEFRKGALRLSFFSMVTTVGAPLDITAQELRIEAFFPADDETERFAREHLRTDT
ncbi:MAG TPA: helix-turn-helix transcriptional regulator [Gemmatimonadaceae bacterium]|nr:helix-turn-helix transcriptional regulator [Gemmatimonadaceae bacterium]